MIKFLLVVLSLFFSTMYGNWEEHLRPCQDKEECCSIPEIDFIYLINLKERPNKWKLSLFQLQPYGITPYRFDAINGWKLDPEIFKSVGCPGLHPDIRPGQIGCILSHLSVLKDAYDSGYETIWVMEDDIDVIEDPRQLSTLIRELDALSGDWDILYTDPETKDYYGRRVPCFDIYPRPNFPPQSISYYRRRISINETFQETGMRYGAYSMIIRRAGIKKILDYFTQYRLFMPIDMELFFVPELKQITILRDVVSTLPGIKSDTGLSIEVNDKN